MAQPETWRWRARSPTQRTAWHKNSHCTSLGIEDVQDAVGECANMVCGRLKQQVEPELFISPPEVGIGLLEKRGRLLTSCVYELSRGPAGVEIWLDSAA